MSEQPETPTILQINAVVSEILANEETAAAAESGLLATHEHPHTWVFLREQRTIRRVTPEIKEKYGKGIVQPDTMIEVHDLYFCSGCPAMRRVHMEDLLESPVSIDGRPHTRIWQKEIPEL